MKPSTCYAHACTVADVEVDDETGEVSVVSVKNVFEIGRALNPRMVEQQLIGGSWMGTQPCAVRDDGALLSEARPRRHRLQRISDAGAWRPAETEIVVLERPAADGPTAQRVRRDVRQPQIPALANAIFDAVGVRFDTMPITPERISGLKEQRAA